MVSRPSDSVAKCNMTRKKLACVASVSARIRRGKLGREQQKKKKKEDGGGEGGGTRLPANPTILKNISDLWSQIINALD